MRAADLYFTIILISFWKNLGGSHMEAETTWSVRCIGEMTQVSRLEVYETRKMMHL